MCSLGLEPDPWQLDVLEGGHSRLLLNCCRQAGKSTVVALLALVEAVFVGGTKVLLVSRSHRQSMELFRIVLDFYRRLGEPCKLRRNSEELALTNLSRIVSLPCREETIRGYGNVSLLVIDEAARVPDDLYRAVRPMLAVSGGRLFCLSTPYGKRGFFHDAWARGGKDWKRIEVPADKIPRITPAFLEEERRCLGESWFRQEYCCSFESLEGLVFPDFRRCLAHGPVPPGGTRVGGLDFGFRNPFAAVWGILDRDRNLWLTGEHYARQQPLSYHAARLPREVMWYADPSGASERSELRRAGFKVQKGINALRPGLASVAARIRNNTLLVLEGACPNLLAEAGLYRYAESGSDRDSEDPVDEHNHALSALRYLIASIDRGRQALPRPSAPQQAASPGKRPWLHWTNSALYTRIW
jgi:hypothetical protein